MDMNASTIGLIIAGAAALYLLICVAYSLLRGLWKTRIRTIGILLSAGISIALTFAMKSVLSSENFIDETLIPSLESSGQTSLVDTINKMMEMFGSSKTLSEVVLGVGGALLAPIFCLLLFIIINIVTWVFHVILTLIFGRKMKAANKKSKFRLARTIVLSAVEALIVIFIFMLPVSIYLGVAPAAVDAVADSGMLEEDAGTLTDLSNDVITPLNEDDVFIKVYRTLGGSALGDAMTTFPVGEEKINLSDELKPVASFACNILKLTESSIAEYTTKEAQLITAVADSFDESKLLPTIVGEVLYSATDAWLNGESFADIEKPNLGEGDSTGMMTDLLDGILNILHKDAKTIASLQDDIRAVADIINVLIEKGILKDISSGNTENLLGSLGSSGAAEAMITAIGSHTTGSMGELVPLIYNVGLKAIASQLNIPENVEEVYGDFLGSVADALNEIRALSPEERIDVLSEKLSDAFDGAGIAIDSTVLSTYSATMIDALIDKAPADITTVTAEDIQDFFSMAAEGLIDAIPDTNQNAAAQVIAMVGTLPMADEEKTFSGRIYSSKTEEELENDGAVVLAKICKQLAEMEAPTEDGGKTIAEQAAEILERELTGLLGEEQMSVVEKIKATEITEPLPQSTITNSVGMQSPEKMADVTVKVTMDKLLIDVESAGAVINSDTIAKDAAAIGTIFNAASTLLNLDTDNIDLTEIATTFGDIMNALGDTAAFNSSEEDKTASLFTAVLQSDTVRESAGLDLTTATELAKAATTSTTEEKVDYSKTMSNIASSVEVIGSMGDGSDLSTDQIVAMIRDITPQTAAMIKVYVTSKRLADMGIPADYANAASPLITGIFEYLSAGELSEDEFDAEADAINQILTIAMDSKNAAGDKKLFGDVLPAAEEAISTLAGSKAITFALNKTLTDGNGNILDEKRDPFHMSEKLTGETELNEFKDAASAYYEEHNDDETAKALNLVGALFGVDFHFNEN